ncbi:metalloregulator ArsR/SmtB family transcription factor [Vibrio sp. AND4]|uniref:helix-turn-helix transcriptional regulator n=1 Tax=Vibrio sp. AND4 TaxID=314289 RepID=UPI00015F06FE|nr:metalloregulator ArsR/SmtB family transcription factor [Vibrio sp. AND4]EDP57502.1 triosephosphate isomerase [Vibrio sp. AND4]
MKTVDRILQIVKRDGSVTAKQLSSELGMTTMGARQHLQGLEDDGILSIHDVKVKVGRPARHWSLTQKGHEQFADRHGELAIQFIEAVEHIFGKDGLEKVTSEREKLTLHSYQEQLAKCDSLQSKLEALVTLREQEGYMAELEQDQHGFILIENHCPICKAATRCPSLCQSELNVFQSLLGSDTKIERTEHIISGQRRCVYRIQA